MRPSDATCQNCDNPSKIRYVLADSAETANEYVDAGHEGFCPACAMEWLVEQQLNIVADPAVLEDAAVEVPFPIDDADPDTPAASSGGSVTPDPAVEPSSDVGEAAAVAAATSTASMPPIDDEPDDTADDDAAVADSDVPPEVDGGLAEVLHMTDDDGTTAGSTDA